MAQQAAGKSIPGKQMYPNNNLFVLFSICTWNMRGLGSPETTLNEKSRSERLLKRELLGKDCERYGMDIVGLQETKCVAAEDLMLYNNYRLIIFDQKEQCHGGIGFVISPKMQPHMTTFGVISDRVGFVDFSIPLKAGGMKHFRVVNCWTHVTAGKTKSL